MLMSDGQHPTTNETVVSRDIIDHVATGLSVSDGKADYPEMVSLVSVFRVLTQKCVGS